MLVVWSKKVLLTENIFLFFFFKHKKSTKAMAPATTKLLSTSKNIKIYADRRIEQLDFPFNFWFLFFFFIFASSTLIRNTFGGIHIISIIDRRLVLHQFKRKKKTIQEKTVWIGIQWMLHAWDPFGLITIQSKHHFETEANKMHSEMRSNEIIVVNA